MKIKLFLKFIRFLKPYWTKELLLMILMILAGASSLASPYILKIIIDTVFPAHDYLLLVQILLFLLGINVIRLLIGYSSDYLFVWISNHITMLFTMLVPILIFGAGGKQVMAGTMTVGSLVAFIQYMNRIFDPFRDLMGFYFDAIRASVSMQRIFDLYVEKTMIIISHRLSAVNILKLHTQLPKVGIVGLRLGAFLSLCYSTLHYNISEYIWIEPVLNPVDYLRKLLRNKLMKELCTDGMITSNRDHLLQDLHNNQSIDFEGYEIGSRLYHVQKPEEKPFSKFQGQMLLIHGEKDPETAPAIQQIQDMLHRHNISSETFIIKNANHSFYSIVWERDIIQIITKWLDGKSY